MPRRNRNTDTRKTRRIQTPKAFRIIYAFNRALNVPGSVLQKGNN